MTKTNCSQNVTAQNGHSKILSRVILNKVINMHMQQLIMQELESIPEEKLTEIYDLIHYFRLGISSEQKTESSQVIDMAGSLEAYASPYIPTEEAKQPAWQATLDEKYNRS